MANVQETPSYDAGIYQIETTDPVLGGPNGIANVQAKGLANRTAFLKQQIDQLNSGVLTPAWIASQDYVQGELQKLDFKQSVRAATTANITLSGVQTIDGVALTIGDRVLVKDQIAAAQNGIYLVAAQNWTRSTDSDNGTKLNSGARIAVELGTINAGSIWYLVTSGNISIGSTVLLFSNEHPDASETVKGVVRFATAAEAVPATEAAASDALAASIARVFTILRSAVANASESLRGVLRIGTQSEVSAGSLDTVAVSPQKLKFGFSALIAPYGYIKLPEWLGGVMLQWGNQSGFGSTAQNTKNVTFPQSFTTQAYGAVGVQSYGYGSSATAINIEALTNSGMRIMTGAFTSSEGGSVMWIAWGK